MAALRPILVLLLSSSFLLLGGCLSAQKTMPHLGVGSISIEGNLERKDLTVTKPVEGSSSMTSVLFGLVQVVDGNKLRILGIPFFRDKYTYFSDAPTILGIPLRFGVSPEDRAYYKALESSADADFVLVKSMDRESSGFPILFSTKEVRFRGKAMKVKSDQ